MEQIILSAKNDYKELEDYFDENQINNVFVVCTDSIGFLNINSFFDRISKKIQVTFFNKFLPNPTYESVVDGIKSFKESKSKIIIAVGGGSAMDVAKCIKLFSTMNPDENYLSQEIIPNDITLLAVPTTAGTGSEATKYAVIYYNGEKQSITSESIIPEIVLFDSSALKTLPEYQKKSTMLDALSHSVESYWSINSNAESKEYSVKALKLIIENYKGYLKNDDEACYNMLMAANIAGKAINITQTTAGHAMCYKLTSIYGIAHGHSAALVNSELMPYMKNNLDNVSDIRGKEYVKTIFDDIEKILNDKNIFKTILTELDLYNVKISTEDIEKLVDSVNVTRLKNNPVKLEAEDIRIIYENIFNEIEKRN